MDSFETIEGAIRKSLGDRFHPVSKFVREGEPREGWTGPIDLYLPGPMTRDGKGTPLTMEVKSLILQPELGTFKQWVYRLWYGWHYYEDEEDGTTRICVHYTYVPLGPKPTPEWYMVEPGTIITERKEDDAAET